MYKEFPLACRKISLERRLQGTQLSDEEKKQQRQALAQQERDFARLQRQRMSSDDFEALKLIGRGAFGEVLSSARLHQCSTSLWQILGPSKI